MAGSGARAISGTTPLTVNFTDFVDRNNDLLCSTFGDDGISDAAGPSHDSRPSGYGVRPRASSNQAAATPRTATNYMTVSCATTALAATLWLATSSWRRSAAACRYTPSGAGIGSTGGALTACKAAARLVGTSTGAGTAPRTAFIAGTSGVGQALLPDAGTLLRSRSRRAGEPVVIYCARSTCGSLSTGIPESARSYRGPVAAFAASRSQSPTTVFVPSPDRHAGEQARVVFVDDVTLRAESIVFTGPMLYDDERRGIRGVQLRRATEWSSHSGVG